MKKAEANSATTATRLLDTRPIPQTRGEAQKVCEELEDERIRKSLGELRAKDSRTDPTFQQIRKISGRFEKALDAMFFENSLLGPLTRKHGVF